MVFQYLPTRSTLSDVRQFNPAYDNEKELVQKLRKDFNCLLSYEDIKELTSLKGRVSRQTYRYVQQFINKGGILKKLPAEIQRMICRYLSPEEIRVIKCALHNPLNAFNAVVGPKAQFHAGDIITVPDNSEMLGMRFHWHYEHFDVKPLFTMTKLQYLTLHPYVDNCMKELLYKLNSFVSLTDLRFDDCMYFKEWKFCIPPLASLQFLKTLKFNNSIDGELFPPLLTRFSTVQNLAFKNFRISSAKWLLNALFPHMPLLTKLTINHNRNCTVLSALIFQEILICTQLTALNFSGNCFTHADLSRLTTLKNLKVLKLSRCQLEQNAIENIKDLSTLTFLDISHNDAIMSGSVIGQLPLHRLSTIRMGGIKKGFEIFSTTILTNLTHLNLNSCRFFDPNYRMPVEVKMPLKRLVLANNELTASVLETIGSNSSFAGLTALDLSQCHFGTIGLNIIGRMTELTNLQQLNLSENGIYQPNLLLEGGHSFKYLQTLSLEKNEITRSEYEKVDWKKLFPHLVLPVIRIGSENL